MFLFHVHSICFASFDSTPLSDVLASSPLLDFEEIHIDLLLRIFVFCVAPAAESIWEKFCMVGIRNLLITVMTLYHVQKGYVAILRSVSRIVENEVFYFELT